MISAAEIGRPPELDSSQFNDVVASAELAEVRLVNSSFSVQPVYFDAKEAENFEFNLNSNSHEPYFDDESLSLFAAFDYSVQVKKEDEVILECKAQYVTVFNLNKAFDFKLIAYFARKVGSNISYPYFREHVAGQSWASGTNLPVLPLMKIGAGEAAKAPKET